MSSNIEFKNYGPHRYTRVENIDDICALLLDECLKQQMPAGGGFCYKSDCGKIMKLHIEITEESKKPVEKPENKS